MANLNTEFQEPLTRPGIKHDEEMSICSSTPQAHKGYINSSLLEDDLKMSKSHATVQSYDECVLFVVHGELIRAKGTLLKVSW